jgi:hypothetical protein
MAKSGHKRIVAFMLVSVGVCASLAKPLFSETFSLLFQAAVVVTYLMIFSAHKDSQAAVSHAFNAEPVHTHPASVLAPNPDSFEV